MITVHTIRPAASGFGMFERSVDGERFPQLDSAAEYAAYVEDNVSGPRLLAEGDEDYAQVEDVNGRVQGGHGKIMGFIDIRTGDVQLVSVE